MGIDRWSYMGPYAELPVTLKSQRVDQCPQKASCPNQGEGAFCSLCGMQLSRRFHEFQAADPPVSDFLWKELNEALMTTDGTAGPERIDATHVVYRLVGNVGKPGQLREFFLGDSDVTMDLTNLDMQAEIDWFKKAFAEEFMKIQMAYGGLLFKWGYLQWFH